MIRNMVAFDCGNSSLRVILGTYEGERITTEVISQIPNYTVRTGQYEYWDILMIYHKLLEGLKKAVKKAGRVDSLGICTWGVDFALFDQGGQMVRNPLSYRNEIGAGVLDQMPGESRDALYRETGVLCDKINSVYMLKGIKEGMPQMFVQGERLLMIPDILNYMFTGHMVNEPSELSTTQLMDARTRRISKEALRLADIPEALFGKLGEHGTLIGLLQEEIKKYLGISYDIPVVCVPSHDTAAAVFAIPAGGEEFLFISAGTWALIGMETEEPVVDDRVRKCCLTNEVGAFNRITLLRNSVGMFLLQRLREEYENAFGPVSWEELNGLGDPNRGEVPFFDVNDPRFFHPVHMGEEIWAYLEETGQVSGSFSQPGSWNTLIGSVLESLARSFARVIRDLEEISGCTRDKVYMVGGGSRNVRLCQRTAKITGKCVVTGGQESTSLGNLGAQLKYLEPEKSIGEIRRLIGNSIKSRVYEPVLGDGRQKRRNTLIQVRR